MGFDAKDALNLSSAVTPLFMAHTMPGSGYYNALQSQLGSTQSGLQVLAAEKMAKKKKKKTPWGTIAGTVLPIAAAPFTGGSSLALLPTTASLGSGVDAAIAGDWGKAALGLGGAAFGAYGLWGGAGAGAGAGAEAATAAKGAGIPPVAATGASGGAALPAVPAATTTPGLAGAAAGAGGAAIPAATGGGIALNDVAALGLAGAASTRPAPYMDAASPASLMTGNTGPAPVRATPTYTGGPAGGAVPSQTLPAYPVEYAARMKPKEIRDLWQKNPAQGMSMMKELDKQGVVLNNRQLRAIPLKYRRQLKKEGINIPSMFATNTMNEIDRTNAFTSAMRTIFGMSPYSQIIPGPDGREYYYSGL